MDTQDYIFSATQYAERLYESDCTRSFDDIMSQVKQLFPMTEDMFDEVKDNARSYIDAIVSNDKRISDLTSQVYKLTDTGTDIDKAISIVVAGNACTKDEISALECYGYML